ncbi:MAG TPA: glycosyltransferase family 2 protein [Steroidobacteraceae bacterium]|nr:glycosyltransferase family 2 protein [Steroidobacteraceae bacterium]
MNDAAPGRVRSGTNLAKPPLISVALCTYNGERYLAEQLDSVLAQDYPALEIVAVDDASTDGTLRILEDYRSRHPQLRVIHNLHNLGFRGNFERALQLCQGVFIAPCDQDDVWLPHKLSTLHAAIGNHSMAYADSELIDAHGRSLGRRMSANWRMQDIDDPVALIMDNCVSGHAMLLRRMLLEQAFPLHEGMYHDWWLATVAAAEGGVVYCPEVLVRYRRHAGTVTAMPGTELAMQRRAAQLRGSGLRRHAAVQERLNALVALPGSHGEFCLRLRDLWHEHTEQWCSPALAGLLATHTRRLYRFKKQPAWRLRLKTLRYLTGLKFKRSTGRLRYLE